MIWNVRYDQTSNLGLIEITLVDLKSTKPIRRYHPQGRLLPLFLDSINVRLFMTRLSSFLLAMTMVATLFSSQSEAQRNGLFQKLNRIAGHGFGPGYSNCNPLSDSSYYNPYNAHNSLLVSQHPEYSQYSIESTNLNSGTFHRGIPFSIYAAPIGTGSKAQERFNKLPGDPIGGDFEPAEDGLKKENNKDGNSALFNPSILPTQMPTSKPAGFSKAGFPSKGTYETTPEPGSINPANLYDPFANDK